MQSAYEQYASGCRIISLLTNLEVQLFDTSGVSHLRYAAYDLPSILERLKQKLLMYILQQSFVKEHVYVFRDAIQLEFLATGIWAEAEQWGKIVVGPFIRNAYNPQLLREMSQKERLPLVVQRQLQQSYNMLTMVDEAKQQAISHLLINVFHQGMIEPQIIEIALPTSESTVVKFDADLEQDRVLIERRYESENKLLHAITKGDPKLLKKVMEEWRGIPWPYRHPHAIVRSMKNLSFSHNTLFRKAAESAGVHPLILDSLSGKFAIQIEQAQSMAELTSLYEQMPQVYCSAVRELSIEGLPSLIKEAVTAIRFTIDQPLSLHHIADTLGVHPSYLSRAFKKALGVTLTDYINTLRIEEAKYMLTSSKESVAAIAFSVGYSDPNYFSKVFTKLERVTPHDYRKRKKGEQSPAQPK